MAARGEERRLPAAVRHVLDQDFPAGIELVLAVGPSRDRTREIAGQLAAADSRITVLDNPTGEIPAGLNLRIRRADGLIWFHPALGVAYRPREGLRDLALQYWHYGRWRRVLAREHAGTVNARYLAPPATALAVTAGTLAGLAGVIIGSPVLLAAGFAVPALYTAGILAVTMPAARELPRRALAWLPAALITMHLSWGAGFLASPRGLAGPPPAEGKTPENPPGTLHSGPGDPPRTLGPAHHP
jgi:hypothetical protein